MIAKGDTAKFLPLLSCYYSKSPIAWGGRAQPEMYCISGLHYEKKKKKRVRRNNRSGTWHNEGEVDD